MGTGPTQMFGTQPTGIHLVLQTGPWIGAMGALVTSLVCNIFLLQPFLSPKGKSMVLVCWILLHMCGRYLCFMLDMICGKDFHFPSLNTVHQVVQNVPM